MCSRPLGRTHNVVTLWLPPVLEKFGSKLIQTRFETKPKWLKPFGLAIFWLKSNHLVSDLAIWEVFKLGLKPKHLREPPGAKQVLLTCFYHILNLYIGVIYLKMLFSNNHTCLLMDRDCPSTNIRLLHPHSPQIDARRRPLPCLNSI